MKQLFAWPKKNRAKIVESKIGMIELQDDDESQVSIDDQVLGTDDAESGTRGRVAAWVDNTADQTIVANVK